jgi:protein O-mannosyl-transferase
MNPKMFDLETCPRWMIFTSLIVLVLLLYARVLNFDFVSIDDPTYVRDKEIVLRGLSWEGLYWSFSDFHFCNYHPLTWLSYMLDCELFGLNPGAMHGVNVVFHILNGLLIYSLFEKLGLKRWPAFIGALVFVAHPAQVETVAWISERKNLLSNFFGVLSILFYLRYVRRKSIREYCIAVMLFVLGLLSKSMIVTLPFILLLIDIWPLNRISRESPKAFCRGFLTRVIEKIPFFLCSLSMCVLTVLAQDTALAKEDVLPYSSRLLQSIVNYGHYLKLFFTGQSLNIVHLHPLQPAPLWTSLIGLAIFAGVFFVLLWKKPRFDLLFAWCWFLGTLVPVIGILQVGLASYAERYAYWVFPGLILFVVQWVPDRWLKRKIGILLTILILIVMSAMSFHRVGQWKNGVTLFQSSINEDPDNDFSWGCLGLAYIEPRKYQQATYCLKKSLQLQPKRQEFRYALADVLDIQGSHEALTHVNRLLEEEHVEAKWLFLKANILIAKKDYAGGSELMLQGLRKEPDTPVAFYNLAIAFHKLGKSKRAEQYYKLAIVLDPKLTDQPDPASIR